MTLQDLIELQAEYRWVFLGVLIALPILALVIGQYVGKNPPKGNIHYVYSVLVYAVSIPGMLSLAACIHLFFVDDGDFMKVDMLVYFLPIIVMVTTLSIINRTLPLSQIPGFGRISGLLMIAGVLGLIIFFLNRTFFGVVFFGGFLNLLAMFAVLVVVFVVGSHFLFRRKK